MKTNRKLTKIREHLEKLKKVKRKKHHHLIHKLHKKYGISKKTLFYIKEYGPRANVLRTIMKESLKIILLASIISSIGGITLESIKSIFISIIPLIILLPTFNGMFGDYGIIMSSRFSTMLYQDKIKKRWWLNLELRKLIVQIIIISLIIALLSLVMSFIISLFFGYALTLITAFKIILITLLDLFLLVTILILTSIFGGLYFFKKQEDPNNFLIPITTSIADFGNMIIIAILVILLF